MQTPYVQAPVGINGFMNSIKYLENLSESIIALNLGTQSLFCNQLKLSENMVSDSSLCIKPKSISELGICIHFH